jgi:hypothetical protein
LSVVCVIHQDVVLMNVIMTKHSGKRIIYRDLFRKCVLSNIIRTVCTFRNELQKVVFISFKQKGILYALHNFQIL